MNTYPTLRRHNQQGTNTRRTKIQSIAGKGDGIKLFRPDAEQNEMTALHSVVHKALFYTSSDTVVDDVEVLQKLLDDEHDIEGHHHCP